MHVGGRVRCRGGPPVRPFLLPLSIVVVDQITKWLVIQRLPLYEDLPLIPGCDDCAVEVADRKAVEACGKVLTKATQGLVAVLEARFASLVIGGAIGNLIDRVRFGYVVDFVKMYWENHVWPNYNVADSAISIGLVLLVVDSFRPRERVPAPTPSVP